MRNQTTGKNPISISGQITDEMILRVAKEITVKFIEVGRITPATFQSGFQTVYDSVRLVCQKKEEN